MYLISQKKPRSGKSLIRDCERRLESMPYSHTKLKIPRTLDRRVKLTLAQRRQIKTMYESGKYSQRQLAAMFEVSRRLITYYIDDRRLEHHKELAQIRRLDKRYYDKDKHREYMKKHRHYKQELKMEGKI